MTTASRKTARAALGTLLTSALTGAGKLCEGVYDYLPEGFSGGPYVCVASTGTAPAIQGIGTTKGKSRQRFDILVFVPVPEPGNVDWTAADAQDTLDDIEAVVRSVVDSNKANAAWSNLKFANETGTNFGDYSTITAMAISGVQYDVEKISVECEVFDA